jgi:hypothetical protein
MFVEKSSIVGASKIEHVLKGAKEGTEARKDI